MGGRRGRSPGSDGHTSLRRECGMTVVRPENAQQARLLRLLRDDGPRSRAELGDAVELSRSRLAVELDRLTDLGLVETAGLAASRGGRRSSIVRIARQTRFLGIDIGATSIDVAVTDGELRGARPGVRADATCGRARRWCSAGRWSWSASCGPATCRRASTAPAPACPARCSFRRGRAGGPADHAGLEPASRCARRFASELGCPVLVDNDVNIMALGEQHAGLARSVDDFLFVKIGTGIGCGIVVDGQVYRGRVRQRRRHRPHPGRRRRPDLHLRQHRLPGGVLRRGRARPGRAGRGPVRAVRRAGRAAAPGRHADRGGRRRRRRRRRPGRRSA